MVQVTKIPVQHYALCSQKDAELLFRSKYGREAGDGEIKVYQPAIGKFNPLYFIPIPKDEL